MYYLALTKARQGKVIQAETAMGTGFVSILENLSKEHDEGHVYVASTLRYGIMREMPSLWSGEFHDEAGKSTSLVHAVEGLSLGNEYVTTRRDISVSVAFCFRNCCCIHESDSLEIMVLIICKMPSNGLHQVLAALASSSAFKHLCLEPGEGQGLVPLAQLVNIK